MQKSVNEYLYDLTWLAVSGPGQPGPTCICKLIK